MTDKEKLDKLAAEIERRKKLHEKSLINPIHEGIGLQNVTKAKISELTYLHSFIDSMQEEPKDCMYSKDNYTDEDRKVLCDGCVEECKFNKKEEPVSEDLEKEVCRYINDNDIQKLDNILIKEGIVYVGVNNIKDIARHFANWQKQQMMANAVDRFVIEDIEEGNGDFLLSAEYLSKDMGLKDRQKVKVIVIKDN